MFTLTFGDQGTSGFVNLMTFQCLASELGSRFRIVEPFMVKSALGQNVSANWTEETKFSDVFDIEKVNQFAFSRHFSPLVPYDKFVKDAPHKLLIAQYQCSGLESCRSCGHQDIVERGRIFSELNDFKIVGHVCLEYEPEGKMTPEELKNQLYSKYRMSEVVVMFARFGGVADGGFSRRLGYRLHLKHSACYRRSIITNINSIIRPSQLVVAAANAFIGKYMGDTSYISVMIRIELVFQSHLRDEQIPRLTEKCLNRVYQRLKRLQADFVIDNIFLALDVGKFGSGVFRNQHIMTPILPYFDIFVSRTIKEGMTLSDWDERFTNITSKHNPGFIAVIQKYIAARGDVLVLLGAQSTFQSSTRELYYTLHHENRKVIKLNTSCV